MTEIRNPLTILPFHLPAPTWQVQDDRVLCDGRWRRFLNVPHDDHEWPGTEGAAIVYESDADPLFRRPVSGQMSPEVVKKLSPDIRDLVVWLNAQGFETTDSGDGSNYAAGMECAVPLRMVAIKVDRPGDLAGIAERLYRLLLDHGVDFTSKESDPDGSSTPQIQASYDPHDGSAVVLLLNVLSEHVTLT